VAGMRWEGTQQICVQRSLGHHVGVDLEEWVDLEISGDLSLSVSTEGREPSGDGLWKGDPRLLT
jgi:hypothetical protein